MEASANLSTTDIVAWWGAIIATLVLAWDIFKWRQTGANLRIFTKSGMKTFGIPTTQDDTFVTVRVTNIGDRPTTITVIGLRYYKNRWNKLRNKVDQHFLVPKPSFGHQPLPYVLNVGEEWMGGVQQEEDLVKMARDGLVYIEVCDSVHAKSQLARVTIDG